MWSILVIVYPLSLSLSLMPMAGYSFQGFHIHFEEVHVCVSSLPPSVLFSLKYLSKLHSPLYDTKEYWKTIFFQDLNILISLIPI